MKHLKGTFWPNPDIKAWILVLGLPGKLQENATEVLTKITLNKNMQCEVKLEHA